MSEPIAGSGPELVPVIAQDAVSGKVLMLAWADRESLRRTLATGQAWYYSRSRGEYWRKGATSGNTQAVVRSFIDCDRDVVLLQVDQIGPACHTGNETCFYTQLDAASLESVVFRPVLAADHLGAIEATAAVIADRARNMPTGSYVAGLLADQSGLRALQKVGEEAVEFILAGATMGKGAETTPAERTAAVGEAADLLFHFMVALQGRGITLADVAAELGRRRGKSGAADALAEKLTGQE